MISLQGKIVLIALLLLVCGSCKDDDTTPPSRTYRMGFQNSAPRFDDFDMFIQSLNMWTTRADAAMITTEVPWEELLGGADPIDYVVDNYKSLVEFYRGKDFELWVYIDPQNGLDRTSDALELIDAGKSIADQDMQDVYKRFVVVMDSVLVPEHLGLALETNLIRGAAPAPIYAGVKKCVTEVAAEIRTLHPTVKLSVSVQAEHAWGKFTGTAYAGIDQDLEDFDFIDELGISSYPYFGFDDPSQLPTDYYSKLIDGIDLPVFVSEGGWTSASVITPTETFTSSPEMQRDYIQRHAIILDNVKAIAYFQLVFTDIDIDHLPEGVPENINYFAYLGMVDKTFIAKPALAAWDELFSRSRVD